MVEFVRVALLSMMEFGDVSFGPFSEIISFIIFHENLKNY